MDSPVVVTLVTVTVQQKAKCVLWFAKFKSVVTVQHHFRHTYGQDPQVLQIRLIHKYNQFKETVNVDIKKALG